MPLISTYRLIPKSFLILFLYWGLIRGFRVWLGLGLGYSNNVNRSTIYFQISKIMSVATTIKLTRTYRSAHVFPGQEVWQLRTDPDYQLQISVPSETRPRAHFACTEVTWDQTLFSFPFENYIPAGKAKRKRQAVAVRENVWEPLKLGLISG